MIEYEVKHDDGIYLDIKSELIVTKTILQIVRSDRIQMNAYAICGDHVHMMLEAEERSVSALVGKLKSMSASAYSIQMGIVNEGDSR